MKDLTKGNIYKTFFFFGLPLVLSGLLSQTYGIIDTAIAGRFIGDTALAAIGATAPLVTFLSSLFWGYGVGFSIYIARLFGAKEYKKIKSAVYSTYLFLAIVSICLSGMMIACHDVIFDLLRVEESIRSAAFEYFLWYVGGMFILMLSWNGVYIMTAFGIGSFPFYMSILSTVLNIGGNIFAVVVLKAGVKGLAIASVVAAAVVTVSYILKFLSCLKEMGVQKEKARIGFSYIRESLPYAVPNMVQQMVMYIASLIISPLVNGIGSSASASYSVISRVYDINANVYQNSARSVSNYSAQCLGKKEYGKLKKGVFAGAIQGVLFLTPFLLATIFFREPICSLFFKAGASAEAKQYAYDFAAKCLPFLYLNMICNLFHGFYRGIKDTGRLFTTTLVGTVVRVVATMLLIQKFGMNGFFAGWAISWGVEAVYCLLSFFAGGWDKTKQWMAADEALIHKATGTAETAETPESVNETETPEKPESAAKSASETQVKKN